MPPKTQIKKRPPEKHESSIQLQALALIVKNFVNQYISLVEDESISNIKFPNNLDATNDIENFFKEKKGFFEIKYLHFLLFGDLTDSSIKKDIKIDEEKALKYYNELAEKYFRVSGSYRLNRFVLKGIEALDAYLIDHIGRSKEHRILIFNNLKDPFFYFDLPNDHENAQVNHLALLYIDSLNDFAKSIKVSYLNELKKELHIAKINVAPNIADFVKKINEVQLTDKSIIKFFEYIDDRSATRYGFERGRPRLQGPHTIARCFGYNARFLFLRKIKNKASDINNKYSFEIEDKIEDINFDYLFDFDYPTTHTYIEFKNLLKYQPVEDDKSKENFIHYLKHFAEIKEKYDQIKTSTAIDILKKIAFGQLLADLHPLATSFDHDQDTKGAGEAENFHKIKWIVRIKRSNIKSLENNLENNLENDLIQAKVKSKLLINKGDSTKLDVYNIIIDEIDKNSEDIELIKLRYALKYIVPDEEDSQKLKLKIGANGKYINNKGLVDLDGNNKTPSILWQPFLIFLFNSIHSNLSLVNYKVYSKESKLLILDKIVKSFEKSLTQEPQKSKFQTQKINILKNVKQIINCN